ncbi:MAG: response regulator, partial [Firmicutes bacterium]|nr:response regulator [Bacillota bacterium]
MAIRVLVVDDSAFMRKVISEILNEQEDIEVVGTARNGLDALKKLERFDVDVMTLDLEMPVLDGLETIKRVMSTKPLPILVLSGVTEHSFDITMKALSSGAVDFI